MTTRRSTLQGLAAGAFSLATGTAFSQEQAITVLVGAASSMDFTARVIADQLRERILLMLQDVLNRDETP